MWWGNTNTQCVALPALEEGNVDDGRVVVDKLEGEELDVDAVVVLTLGAQALKVRQPHRYSRVDLAGITEAVYIG